MPVATLAPLSILATFRVKPDQRERFDNLFNQIIVKTRDKDGCLRYELHASEEDSNRLVVIETWASDAALQAHLQQPYLVEMFALQDELMSEPVELTRWSPVQ